MRVVSELCKRKEAGTMQQCCDERILANRRWPCRIIYDIPVSAPYKYREKHIPDLITQDNEYRKICDILRSIFNIIWNENIMGNACDNGQHTATITLMNTLNRFRELLEFSFNCVNVCPLYSKKKMKIRTILCTIERVQQYFRKAFRIHFTLFMHLCFKYTKNDTSAEYAKRAVHCLLACLYLCAWGTNTNKLTIAFVRWRVGSVSEKMDSKLDVWRKWTNPSRKYCWTFSILCSIVCIFIFCLLCKGHTRTIERKYEQLARSVHCIH